jgi:hypothetical protein
LSDGAQEQTASVPIDLLRDIRELINDLAEDEYCTCADEEGKCTERCLFSKAVRIRTQLEDLRK